MQNWKAERRGRRQASACGDPGLPLSISPSPRFPYSSTSLDKLWSVSFHSDTPSIFRLRTIHPGRLDAYRNCAHRPSDFTGLQSQETASVLVRYTTTLLLFHGLRFRFLECASVPRPGLHIPRDVRILVSSRTFPRSLFASPLVPVCESSLLVVSFVSICTFIVELSVIIGIGRCGII